MTRISLNRTATKDCTHLITTTIPTTTMMTHPMMTTTTRNQMPIVDQTIMVTTTTMITTMTETTDPMVHTTIATTTDTMTMAIMVTVTTDTITTAIMVTMTHDTYDSDNYDYDNGGYSDDSDRFYSRYSWSFAVFDSTSSEGVHGGHLHISEVLGITTSTKNELLQPTSPPSSLGPTSSTSSY